MLVRSSVDGLILHQTFLKHNQVRIVGRWGERLYWRKFDFVGQISFVCATLERYNKVLKFNSGNRYIKQNKINVR